MKREYRFADSPWPHQKKRSNRPFHDGQLLEQLEIPPRFQIVVGD
jgi:hypothetical protein